MPNLKPPVTTTELAAEYKARIEHALAKALTEHGDSLPAGAAKCVAAFQPLMSLYLTDRTTPEEIRKAADSGFVFACKLYPAGATTNSDSGVTDIKALYPTLRAMAECGLLLLVHGEVTDPSVDIFDRESVFIERILRPLVEAIPELKVVMEHITTSDAVDFVTQAGDNVAATITCHHLLYNRNAIFDGGICPHMYCLPILKSEANRVSLVQAATSGSPKFFAGTDSAPHPQGRKEASCGCAGCYTAFAAIELYAEAFDQAGALDKLPAFLGQHGAAFYGLSPGGSNSGDESGWSGELIKQAWKVPELLPFCQAGDVVPLRAGEEIQWSWSLASYDE